MQVATRVHPEVTRILVVDDHFVARDGIKLLTRREADLEVVGEAASGSDAVGLYRELEPDLVIMDLRMRGFDGLAAIQAIRQIDPRARILVLSSYQTEHDVLRVRDSGALGFIMKEAEAEDMLVAMRKVAGGEAYLPPGYGPRVDEAEGQRLNARDVQLLRLMSQGLSRPEMGKALSLAEGTINRYLASTLRKMGVSNNAEAVFEARRRGIVR